MFSGLSKTLRGMLSNRKAQPPQRMRRFDGAAGGPRWHGNPTFNDINAESLTGAERLRRRAAYACRNNGWTANGVSGLVANIVGSGIRPASQHPDPAVRTALEKAWARWCVAADADGVTDFYGLQAMAVRQMVEAGECFGRFEASVSARNGLFKLRLVDAAMVDLALTRELDGDRRIVGGVEFDGAGQRVAYHVSPKRPGQLFTIVAPPVRISAADMVHLFAPLVPGQVRGISWLAPVLLRLHDLDEYEDAQLVRQKIASLFVGYIKRTNIVDPDGPIPQPGKDAPQGSNKNDGEIYTGMTPGTLQVLREGEDMGFSKPPEVGDNAEFIRLQLRGIAAGLGVPDYILTGDLSQANYSSMRAGLVEFRRRVEMLQYSVVIRQFCRPIWERFVLASILSGAIAAPDFEAHVGEYLSAEWYPPTQEWVDPMKDAQAEELAVANGFKSRRQVVTERGYSVEQVDAEIAADQARAKKLGITVGPKSGAVAPQPQDQSNG